MHHTAHLALIFGFYGDTVAVITHGNDCILQKGTVSAVYHRGQLAVDFFVGGQLGTTDTL